MALKQLMINKKINERKAALDNLRKTKDDLAKREADLEQSIEEANTEEEIKTVEEEVESLNKEKEDNDEAAIKLEAEIKELEGELETVRSNDPTSVAKKAIELPKNNVREGENKMLKRGIFAGMTMQERSAFVEREDVKEFLTRTRELIGQKRAVTGAELNIPDVALEIIRDNLYKYSKLIGLVRLKKVSGKARQNVAGTIPEGVWTEAIANLNELVISFNQVEVDGYKVGGFIPVPNSILEDSDINLATEIFENLGQAIGYAIDKAILYGTGVKMPVGIVTRLAQAAKPSNWGTNAPTWTDLHTSNITKLNILAKTGAEFFAALILGLGVPKENYSDGKKFWCMNSTTKTLILSKSITFDAAGTIVASAKDEMPVIGGSIITLPFMTDNEIVGGYGALYLLAERKDSQFAVSDQVKFIEDQTVFKGTARYDGTPVIGEGFVATTLENVAVTTTVTFAADAANAVAGE